MEGLRETFLHGVTGVLVQTLVMGGDALATRRCGGLLSLPDWVMYGRPATGVLVSDSPSSPCIALACEGEKREEVGEEQGIEVGKEGVRDVGVGGEGLGFPGGLRRGEEGKVRE